MAPTIKEIAELAKVSPATVSLVLNEKGSISEETRTEVKRMIREMGYKRRPSGRVIGLIGHVPTSLVKCLQQAAAEYGYDLEQMKPEELTPSRTASDPIGGTIIYGGQWDPASLAGLAGMYPSILLGGHTRRPHVDSIWVDNAESIELAVAYLVEREHRTFGLINGPKDTPTSWEKETGFHYSVSQFTELTSALVHSASFSPTDARTATLELLSKMPDVTALIVAEARMGRPVYELLIEQGLKIPDDISLIVFRDAEYMMETQPPLTAIGFSYLGVSRETMTHLVRRINDPTIPGKRVLLRPHIIERGSVCTIQ